MRWGEHGDVRAKKHVGKWIPEAIEITKSILKKGGWFIQDLNLTWGSIYLSAWLGVDDTSKSIEKTVDCVNKSTEKLRL